MNQNEREQELIKIRRLRALRDEYWMERDKVEYVPLERPQFAGWEVRLGVSDEALRRDDAQILVDTIGVTRLVEPLFVRNENFIKELRGCRYKYVNVMRYRAKLFRRMNFAEYWNNTYSFGRTRMRGFIRSSNMNYFSVGGRSSITEAVYKNLKPQIKRWFVEDTERRYYNSSKKYVLSWSFPWRDLVFKVKKAYYTQKLVPNSIAQSEYTKLDDKLKYHKLYAKSYNGKFDGRWRDDYTAGIRASWRVASRKFILYANDGGLDDESEVQVLQGTKAFNRSYGWD